MYYIFFNEFFLRQKPIYENKYLIFFFIFNFLKLLYVKPELYFLN